eukprot:1701271-Ditylum_brightwellii.AAC.1
MGLKEEIMKAPTGIYNDNNACMCYSHNLMTKGLCHIQIRVNDVQEAVQDGTVMVKHIAGEVNLSGLFMKEGKDTVYFLTLWDHLLEVPPQVTQQDSKNDIPWNKSKIGSEPG